MNDTILNSEQVKATPITFLEKMLDKLEAQGRTKVWLADFLSISRNTLYLKIANDDFKDNEKECIRKELGF